MPVDRSSIVTLRRIDSDNKQSVLEMDVHPLQSRYVASNAASLAAAEGNLGSWFRAVYADEMPVGFVLIFDPRHPGAVANGPIEQDEIGLWRLMIDRRYQRLGFGRNALDLVFAEFRKRPGVRKMLSSFVPGTEGPEAFYLAYGFTKTGRMRAGGKEVEIVCSID
jgi:diamine N-acetyltransferase